MSVEDTHVGARRSNSSCSTGETSSALDKEREIDENELIQFINYN